MNAMLLRAGLGYRLFLYATALVMGLGFVLPAKGFYDLVLPWCGCVIVFALIGVWRWGLLRGFATPTAALLAVAFFDGGIVLPLCMDVWLLSALLCVSVVLLRSAGRWLWHYLAAGPGRARNSKPELVSVAVRGNGPEICAADVLAQFGFGEGD